MPDAATTEFAVASRPVALMHERVVATYDTREEAEAALDWYVRTYDPPTGALFIREVETMSVRTAAKVGSPPGLVRPNTGCAS